MEDVKSIVAKNITELRILNNMTQMELGEKLNYSDKSISKWERGESLPDITVLVEIADLFGVSLDYLVRAENIDEQVREYKRKEERYNRRVITYISEGAVWLIALFAFIIPESDVFWTALLLGASLLGFIPNNRHPARIFMGDCGSLFIGYSLSLLSLRWFSLSPSPLNAIAIILLFFVPVSDTLQSFFRRIRNGKSPFAADKEHLHHKLLSHGFSPQCTALAMITVSAFFEFVAVLLLN